MAHGPFGVVTHRIKLKMAVCKNVLNGYLGA